VCRSLRQNLHLLGNPLFVPVSILTLHLERTLQVRKNIDFGLLAIERKIGWGDPGSKFYALPDSEKQRAAPPPPNPESGFSTILRDLASVQTDLSVAQNTIRFHIEVGAWMRDLLTEIAQRPLADSTTPTYLLATRQTHNGLVHMLGVALYICANSQLPNEHAQGPCPVACQPRLQLHRTTRKSHQPHRRRERRPDRRGE